MTTTSKFTRRALRLLAAGTVAAGVSLPAVAMAQQGGDEYPTPSSTPEVPSTVPETAVPGGTSTSVERGADGGGGSLPVTGGQIAGLTLIGLGITGAGVVMVRLGRRPARVET
jgi:hypothetical protein